MANIFDYLNWRGDLSFEQDPFNEVDNLVLSWLSYVALDEIMPMGICSVSVSIREACDMFFNKYSLEEKLKEHSMTKTSALLFDKLKLSKRFANIYISNYVNQISFETEKQFSAMTLKISEDLYYIAYRGTDDTIVGWKEDFNMSFLSFTPAQKEAVDYLNASMKKCKSKIILGGHSKGGNLAVYAGIHCDENIKANIIKIYNNDGPGFLKSTLVSPEYQEMIPKITTIVPESSVVGMLLGHEEEYKIVRSSQKGILQHDAGSWEVIQNRFVSLPSTSKESEFIDLSLKEWITGLTPEQRKTFVDGLFSLLEASGAKTIGDIYNLGIKNVTSSIKAFNGMDNEMKQKLLLITKSLFDIMSTNLKSKVAL